MRRLLFRLMTVLLALSIAGFLPIGSSAWRVITPTVTTDWGTAEQRDEYGTWDNIIDNNDSSYFEVDAKRDDWPSDAGLQTSSTARLRFPPVNVDSVRVRLLIQVFANNSAWWEYRLSLILI